MRITNATMVNSYLKDIQNNLQGMDKLNTQLNTGKQVNKISDDPLKTVKILNMNNEIQDVENFNSSCDEITGWLDINDEALNTITTLTGDIKVLLTSISGTFGKDEINAVKVQVNEKIKQIGEAMNTTFAGKFVFGGSITDEPPVSINTNAAGEVSLTINNQGDSRLEDKLNVVVSKGINVNYNLGINTLVKTDEAGTTGLELLNNLSKTLNTEPLDMEAIKDTSKKLDAYMSNILSHRTIVGAKTNTIESIKSANEENILEMKGALSITQDVDFAEKYIELKSAEMIYNSSLQVGSKLFKSTLLDYLR